jgi:hypothetical protein
LELSRLAEKTKATLEGMQGEATAETAANMESAATDFQSNLEVRSAQAEQKAQEIHDELFDNQKEFSQGIMADKSDLTKLDALKNEAGKVGVDVNNIDRAEKAKQQEISFLDTESKAAEKSQKDIQKALSEAKQKRQAAQFSYKSKSTLGS